MQKIIHASDVFAGSNTPLKRFFRDTFSDPELAVLLHFRHFVPVNNASSQSDDPNAIDNEYIVSCYFINSVEICSILTARKN